MNITDPERAINALIGLSIDGLEITDDRTVLIVLNNGLITIDFDEEEIYIEVSEQQ